MSGKALATELGHPQTTELTRLGGYSPLDLTVKVKMRDGHKCVLIGYQDTDHPFPDENIPSVFLKACHILLGAVSKFDEDPKSDSFMSAATTFDILANYACPPKETFEDLQNQLDDPSNGMMLQSDARDAYDRFFHGA